MQFFRSWFETKKINPQHQKLPIKQAYCWLWTRDKKIALVSKDGKSWQFPGGHPKKRESLFETLKRELKEELSFEAERITYQPKLFGYYLIEGIDEGKVKEKYLQLRAFLPIDKYSNAIDIKPNENLGEKEEDKINFSGWFSLDQAKRIIPWLAGSEELRSFLKLIS